MVVRINEAGKLCNSEPCSVCTQLIKKSNIGDVFYSDGTGEIVRVKPVMLKGLHKTKGFSKCDSDGTFIAIIFARLDRTGKY